jgi:hypothetical protein
MSHGKLICKVCKDVIVQCRCPDHGGNVTESFGPCDKCKTVEVEGAEFRGRLTMVQAEVDKLRDLTCEERVEILLNEASNKLQDAMDIVWKARFP